MLNSLFDHLCERGKSGFVPAVVASKCVVGLMGSDPNSGQSLRAGQRGFLGSDRNFGQAEGGANLGSDPNSPHPNNPGLFSPCSPTTVASNWVVGIDALLFVFILAPLTLPRPGFWGQSPNSQSLRLPLRGVAQSATAKLVSDPNNRGANSHIWPRL